MVWASQLALLKSFNKVWRREMPTPYFCPWTTSESIVCHNDNNASSFSPPTVLDSVRPDWNCRVHRWDHNAVVFYNHRSITTVIFEHSDLYTVSAFWQWYRLRIQADFFFLSIPFFFFSTSFLHWLTQPPLSCGFSDLGYVYLVQQSWVSPLRAWQDSTHHVRYADVKGSHPVREGGCGRETTKGRLALAR